MDLLQLRYFQTVARLENVTHAAEELHIAQPCISRAIARLEDSVGVALFERTGKRIRLNEFGRVFLKRVERCFNELEEGQRELADLAGAKRGKIVVGATIARILPGLFGEFLKTRPTVQFQLFQAASQQDVQKRLLGGEIDLCFTTQPVELPKVHDEPLFSEEIILAVGEGHRLAKKKSVRLEEISGEPLIDFAAECHLCEVVSESCQRAGFSPEMAFECTSPEVVCGLARAGFGAAFLPAYLWDMLDTQGLVRLSLRPPGCRRTIWLSWVKKHYLSVAARDFCGFARGYFSFQSEGRQRL